MTKAVMRLGTQHSSASERAAKTDVSLPVMCLQDGRYEQSGGGTRLTISEDCHLTWTQDHRFAYETDAQPNTAKRCIPAALGTLASLAPTQRSTGKGA